MVHKTLNKIKWTGKMWKCRVFIINRGEPDDTSFIHGNVIKEIKKGHFTYMCNEEETLIPNHRVKEIIYDGKVVYKKRGMK